MSLTAVDILEAVAPQYTAHPLLSRHITLAEMSTAPVSASGWNSAVREKAIALRAAHTMTLALDPAFAGGGGGGVQMRREGDLQVQYRTTAAKVFDKYPGLSQTSYGTDLIDLIEGNIIGIGCSSGIEDLRTDGY